jgi:hypothetical protein
MGRAWALVTILALLSAPGCTSNQLKRSTVNQAGTLSEMHYQMVLRNLAEFAANPGAMPWHIAVTGGTAQVTDSGRGGFTITHNTTAINPGLALTYPQLQATRTIVQQWSVAPVTDGDALRLLQFGYRRALGIDEMPDAKLLNDMAHDLKEKILSTEDLRSESEMFYRSLFAKEKSYESVRRGISSSVGDQEIVKPGGESEPSPLPRAERMSPLAREVAHRIDDIVDDLKGILVGWFCVGRKRDVPRDACHVAHCGEVYVWVPPSGLKALTDFTLTILDLGSALQSTTPQSNIVTFSPGFVQ